MSEAFLMRRGGSGGAIGAAFALIAVTYPATSSCTATDGTKTLRAKSRNGAYCFAVPNAGTWTVTIRDEEHGEASSSVTIITEGQVEKLTMTFFDDLFNAGTGKENWSVRKGYSGDASVGDRLHLYAPAGDGYLTQPGIEYVYTSAPIEMSGKQSVEVVASTIFSGALSLKAGKAQIRVIRDTAGTEVYIGETVAAADLTAGTDQPTSLSIAGLAAGEYRIVFYAAGAYHDDQVGGIDTLTTTIDVESVRLI